MDLTTNCRQCICVQFENRMQKYVRQSFLPQHLEIHWFSIINSSVLVLLLLGILVTIFMRVLKHDFAKFSHDDELGDDAEETGVHQKPPSVCTRNHPCCAAPTREIMEGQVAHVCKLAAAICLAELTLDA